jgi:Protein of unknown function (DUF3593)
LRDREGSIDKLTKREEFGSDDGDKKAHRRRQLPVDVQVVGKDQRNPTRNLKLTRYPGLRTYWTDEGVTLPITTTSSQHGRNATARQSNMNPAPRRQPRWWIVLLWSASTTVQAFVTPLRGSATFAQQNQADQATPARTALHLFDPSFLSDASTNLATSMESLASMSSSTLLSFTDQGQNLAGTFFQASLLPYLVFLYFLSFRGNRLSDTANFGFQFILLFVLTTIPSGILCKSVYGTSLANVRIR